MRYAAISLIALAIATVTPSDDRLVDVSDRGGIYGELGALLETWTAAVRERDLNTLVQLAAPEDREGVRAALADEHSELTNVLFLGSQSVREQFAAFPKPRIYLFAHPHLSEFGNGTTGCITGGVLPRPMPTRIVDLPASSTSKPIFCQFFYRSEEKWHPNYSYGWPNEGGDDVARRPTRRFNDGGARERV